MFRKISIESVEALFDGVPFSKGNTAVVICEDGTKYLALHGNPIIQHHKEDGYSLSSCGWRTNTTRERLNCFLWIFMEAQIKQRDYVWYIKGREFFDGITLAEIRTCE